MFLVLKLLNLFGSEMHKTIIAYVILQKHLFCITKARLSGSLISTAHNI